MVYHKNAVVNCLHFGVSLNAMMTAEIRATIIPPMMWPRHFGKLRFTRDTPTATPDSNNGTGWLNLDMPNVSSKMTCTMRIQLDELDESGAVMWCVCMWCLVCWPLYVMYNILKYKIVKTIT